MPFYRNALQKQVDKLLWDSEQETHFRISEFDSGKSEPGCLSLADRAIFADLFIPVKSGEILLYDGMANEIQNRLHREIIFNYCVNLVSFVEDLENLTERQRKLCGVLDKVENNIWECDYTTLKEITELANSLEFSLDDSDAQDFRDFHNDNCQKARLRIGFTIRERDREKPFYAFASLNFDDPYFRSNAEIARNGKPNRQLDILLGEYESDKPKSERECEIILSRMLDKAFPKWNLKVPDLTERLNLDIPLLDESSKEWKRIASRSEYVIKSSNGSVACDDEGNVLALGDGWRFADEETAVPEKLDIEEWQANSPFAENKENLDILDFAFEPVGGGEKIPADENWRQMMREMEEHSSPSPV